MNRLHPFLPMRINIFLDLILICLAFSSPVLKKNTTRLSCFLEILTDTKTTSVYIYLNFWQDLT